MAIEEILNDGNSERIVKQTDMTVEERKRFQLRCDLFYSNIPLLFSNSEKILLLPHLYSVKAPQTLFETVYMNVGDDGHRVITIGELLLLWQNEKAYSGTCPKCDGKNLLFRFCGSAQSGTIFERKSKCVECGHIDDSKYGNFVELTSIRQNYQPVEPISERPAFIAELIDVLNGVEMAQNITDEPRQPELVTAGIESRVKIGKHEWSQEQFMLMLIKGFSSEKSGKNLSMSLPPFIPPDDIRVIDGEKITRFCQIENGSFRKIFDSTPPQERLYYGDKEEALIVEKYHEGTYIGVNEEGPCTYLPELCKETNDGITCYGLLSELTMSRDGKRLQFFFLDDGCIEVYERVAEVGYYRDHLPNIVGEMSECPRCGRNNQKECRRIWKCPTCYEFSCMHDECGEWECPNCSSVRGNCELFEIT